LLDALFKGKFFREKLVEYAYGACQNKQHLFLNFALNITRGCDCEPLPMKACIDDIGIFASLDPVAIDQACWDMAAKKGKAAIQKPLYRLWLPDQTEQIAALYTDYPNMELTGIYTHFHSARNASVTQNQFDRFQRVVSALRQAGFDPGMVHCCNSTAFWKYEHMHCDAVRVGSAVLGRVNFEGKTGLQKVGLCQAELEEIRTIPAGHSVGYGAGWKAKKDTRIAVLSVGYINGFSVDRGFDLWRFSDCLRGIGRYIKAFLKKKALYVRVKGKACRVLGHVGMVNMVIDVTGCDCQPGDLAHVEINPLLVRNMEIVFR
jgi:alanine racemase